LEITGEGLVLGAGTILAKMGGDSKGSPELSLDDERRIMAILATAYGRPLQAHVLDKMRRAAELWNGGDKALAHIHLAFAGLPPCDDMDLALRLFVADELIEAGASPATLMKAQGFDTAPLDMLKFNPAQPRWPAGNGDESGEWSGGGGTITPVAFRGGKERRRQGGRGSFNPFRAIGEFIDEFRKPKESEPVPEAKRPEREDAKPESTSPNTSRPQTEISAPNPSDFVGQDFGKLGVGVEKPIIGISELDEHAIQRMAERGISSAEMEETVANPLIVLRQARGRFYYLSDNAAVVLNRKGRVITTYPASEFDAKIKDVLDHVHRGGKNEQ
jgi:hypothetical protein